MSIIHVNQIKNQLEKLFTGRINLADVPATGTMHDNFFLTRALAAYSLYYLAQASEEQAADAITDGGDDNGIDAVHYDERDRQFYIVQSKWIHNGRGEPENGDVKKYIAGIRDLFNLDFERFNAKVKAKKGIITAALNDPNTRYEVILAYTGINRLADPSARDLQDLLDEMNDASEVLRLTVLNQADLHTSLTAGISGEPIDLEIGLKGWGKVHAPHEAYYGRVDGQQLAKWWKKYRTRLFARNLRSVLGDTDVNDEIRRTIAAAPEHFWYYNNGVTLISKRVAKTMAGGAETDFGTFHCYDVSVVNGAQTVGAVGKYGETSETNLDRVYVPLRIISLEHGEAGFGDEITKTNNRQNRIENRDFVTLDPEQSRLRTELAIDGIEYHLMRSEAVTRTADTFDLVESTSALACASGKPHLVVQLKREIGKLWENIERAPYRELFNPTVPGLAVWRAVQVQRRIDHALDAIILAMGVRSGREYGIAVHGNRMIAALVFGALPTTRFADPEYTLDEHASEVQVRELTEKYYERLRDAVELHYSNAIIPTLFKNLTKCKHLLSVCAAVATGENTSSEA